MDFELSEDQNAFVDSVRKLLDRHMNLPKSEEFFIDKSEVRQEIVEAGFMNVADMDGFGPLEAALLVYEAGRRPFLAEVAISAIVAPQISEEPLEGPLAIMRKEDAQCVRFLDRAKTVIIDEGEDVSVLTLQSGEVEPVTTPYAYPCGRFTGEPDFARARRLGSEMVDPLRRWWRIALAVETAAAGRGALDFTVGYVQDRRQFGRPIGSFQAVQHRLAECAVYVEGCRWLALVAAWRGRDDMAALAATYAANIIPKIAFDVHQFNGALGMTLEHALHFWTYRLKALQGEMGGHAAHALAATEAIWENKRNANFLGTMTPPNYSLR